MKKLTLIACLLTITTSAFAYELGSKPSEDSNYSHDAYGRLSRTDNLNKDTDHDGVSNYYDRNDRNPYKS